MGNIDSSSSTTPSNRQRRRCASVFSDDETPSTSGTVANGSSVTFDSASTNGTGGSSSGTGGGGGHNRQPSARQLPNLSRVNTPRAITRSQSAAIHAEEDAIEREIAAMKLTSAQSLIKQHDTISIGKGSFGQVFKVRLPSGRVVAVKVLRADAIAEAEAATASSTASLPLSSLGAGGRRGSSNPPSPMARPRTPELPSSSLTSLASPGRPSLAPAAAEVFETAIHEHPLHLWNAASESLDTIEEGPESPDPNRDHSGWNDKKDDGPTSEVCFCGKVCTTGYRCAEDGFFMCTTCGKTLGKALHKPIPRSYTAMFRTSTASVATNVILSSPTLTNIGSNHSTASSSDQNGRPLSAAAPSGTTRVAEVKQNQWHARLARAEEVAKLLRERDHAARHFVRIFANIPAYPLADNISSAAAADAPRALIMEYCQGSVAELILDRVMFGYTVAETLLIGDQILRALLMMHDGGDPILHLEINSKNILYHILGPEDEEHGFAVKLTDFGIHTTTSITSITTHPRLKVEDHAPAAIDCDLWSVAVLLWCIRTGHSHGTETELRQWMNEQSSRGDGVAIIVKLALDKIAPVAVASSPSSNNSPSSAATTTTTTTKSLPSLYVADNHIEPVVDWTASDMLAAIAAAMPAALRADLPQLQEHAEDSYTSSPMRRGLLAELLRTKAIRGL